MTKTILAIESSCDETAMSVVQVEENSAGFEVRVLSNVVASQIDLHKKYGGVYPELASRAHLEAAIPVLKEALLPLKVQNAKIKNKSDNSKFKNFEKIDAIAVTSGPGLIGSLRMGVEAAQILASYFDKPLISVNHLEGHLYSAFTATNYKLQTTNVPKSGIFPILALVVSGGHTSLIKMDEHLKYETVGRTIDDAAGEAFDKVARILDLGYPGGPAIEKLAKEGDENAIKLPLSMLQSGDLNFSFSGLKTAVLYKTKNPATGEKREFNRADLAASFQKTVCEILTKKTLAAIKKYNPKTVILSGGVSANQYLRDYFISAFSQLQTTDYKLPATILIPPRELSTDNAVGIAIAGALKLLAGQKTDWKTLEARDNWKIDEL